MPLCNGSLPYPAEGLEGAVSSPMGPGGEAPEAPKKLYFTLPTKSSVKHFVGRPMGLTLNTPVFQGLLKVNGKAEKDV